MAAASCAETSWTPPTRKPPGRPRQSAKLMDVPRLRGNLMDARHQVSRGSSSAPGVYGRLAPARTGRRTPAGPESGRPATSGPRRRRQTRAGPGRSAAVRVRVRTRAPRVATNVIRSAARPVRSYLHTPIGSRHSGPRPQRRGRSRSKVPRTGTFGPRPGAGPTPGVRVHGERRDRAAIAAARRRGPGRRPPARGGVTGGGRAVFGAGGRRRAATAAPVVRTGSAPPSPTRRAA